MKLFWHFLSKMLDKTPHFSYYIYYTVYTISATVKNSFIFSFLLVLITCDLLGGLLLDRYYLRQHIFSFHSLNSDKFLLSMKMA